MGITKKEHTHTHSRARGTKLTHTKCTLISLVLLLCIGSDRGSGVAANTSPHHCFFSAPLFFFFSFFWKILWALGQSKMHPCCKLSIDPPRPSRNRAGEEGEKGSACEPRHIVRRETKRTETPSLTQTARQRRASQRAACGGKHTHSHLLRTLGATARGLTHL